mgnify:CR=1 FL=1
MERRVSERRSTKDRRKMVYDIFFPERRNGKERRQKERRS